MRRVHHTLPDRTEATEGTPDRSEVAQPAQPAEDLLHIAKVVKPWGLRGHVKLLSYAESPDLFGRVPQLFMHKGGRAIALEVEDIRLHRGRVLLKFQGRDRIEDVEDLLQETLYMHKRDLDPLEPGEYYWFQLIGMEVHTDSGTALGTLREIITTGSNDVYVVREGSREWLIPATDQVVLDVDVNRNRMTVHPLEGMTGTTDEHDL